MENTTTITEQPVVTNQPVTPSIIPQNVVVEEPIKDLTTKVSEFKRQSQVQKNSQDNTNNIMLDQKMIDAITDPVLKEAATNLHKSLQSDYTKKTQTTAELRKETEAKIAQMQNWSPERIQRELLNNPQFLEAAQKVALQNPPNSGLTDQQFSALTDSEKAEMNALKSKISTLEQSNFQATVAQRDSQLQMKYSDYNPTQIDETIRQLAQMSPLDIREHVHKSLKHDEDVAAAYQLGLQEAKGLNQTKINAITQNGNSVTNSDGLPTREKGDTDQTYFMKMAQFRLAQFKNRK